MLNICYPLHTDLSEFRELEKTRQEHVSFINFKPLELYWIYLLALQTMTPKVSPKRLMSLDHKLKMRWRTSSFVVILYKYELLLKKPFAMSARNVIWAVIFDSLCEPNSWVMIPIDEKEMWAINLPLEVRISRAMWAQSMRYKLILGFK